MINFSTLSIEIFNVLGSMSANLILAPIYKSGMDYWKNYESHLEELKINLKY